MANPIASQLVVGNIGKIYDKRTFDNGNSVIDFSVASTPRKKVGNDWVDGETVWTRITAWNKLADNVAESFRKGDRVFVYGRLEQKADYEDRQTGETKHPQPTLRAEFAGLEVSLSPAHSEYHSGSTSRSETSSTPKPARKPKADPKPVVEDEDLFGDTDDDDEDTPF